MLLVSHLLRFVKNGVAVEVATWLARHHRADFWPVEGLLIVSRVVRSDWESLLSWPPTDHTKIVFPIPPVIMALTPLCIKYWRSYRFFIVIIVVVFVFFWGDKGVVLPADFFQGLVQVFCGSIWPLNLPVTWAQTDMQVPYNVLIRNITVFLPLFTNGSGFFYAQFHFKNLEYLKKHFFPNQTLFFLVDFPKGPPHLLFNFILKLLHFNIEICHFTVTFIYKEIIIYKEIKL